MTKESSSITTPSLHSNARWLLLGAVILLIHSVLRGLRAPDRWACTQLLFNYDFGFAKRALQGALLSVLEIPGLYQYSFCFWYAVTVLAANIALLIVLLKRLCDPRRVEATLAAYVFSSSLAVVVLAHTMGYGDNSALLVTLLIFVVERFYVRAVLAALLFPACVLVHETQFVIFFPAVAWRFLLDLEAPDKNARVLAFCGVCLCVLVALLWVTDTHLSESSARAMYESIQAKADYPLRAGPLRALTATFGDFVQQMPEIWRRPEYRRFFVLSWLVTAPTTAYLVYSSWRMLTHQGCSYPLRGAALIASLAPLAMHFIALDYNRWTTLATTTSFLVLATAMLRFGASGHSARVPTRVGLALPAVLVAMNLGSSIPLFNGYIAQNFPYEKHAADLIAVLEGAAPFPPEPERCGGDAGCVTIIETLQPPQSAVSKDELHR